MPFGRTVYTYPVDYVAQGIAADILLLALAKLSQKLEGIVADHKGNALASLYNVLIRAMNVRRDSR